MYGDNDNEDIILLADKCPGEWCWIKYRRRTGEVVWRMVQFQSFAFLNKHSDFDGPCLIAGVVKSDKSEGVVAVSNILDVRSELPVGEVGG